MNCRNNFILRQLGLVGSFLFLVLAGFASAGMNSLTTGLSVSYDYDERKFEQEGRSADVTQQISIRPMIFYEYSTSALDTLGIRVAPSVVYDLEESKTDWDYNDLLVTFEKSLSRQWTFNVENSFLRSDDQEAGTDRPTGDETTEEEPQDIQPSQTAAPELSSDAGRNRYWSNDLQLGTDYTYSDRSLVHLGLGYTVLRNDSDSEAYQDYDRYAFNVRNEHLYNPFWRTAFDLSYIIGEYDETSTPIETVEDVSEETLTPTDAEVSGESLSDDVKEYRFSATLENYSFRQNVISLNYNYTGAKYEEELQDDTDIHQGRLVWERHYSPQLSTTLGAGPSYEKTEGRDANYGGNGTAAISYRMRHSSVSFEVEKNYDVENFTGTDERGSVDTWDLRLLGDYNLTRDLMVDGSLSYSRETREEPTIVTDATATTDETITTDETTATDTTTADSETTIEEYSSDLYGVGLGLSYRFLRYYTASLRYTFSKQLSDRIEDEYDNHRIMFTLSWSREVLRW